MSEGSTQATPAVAPASRTSFRLISALAWVFVTAFAVVAIVAEPLTMLDSIEKLLAGWRDFTRSIWHSLLAFLPAWCRPYESPFTHDMLTVLTLLVGGLLRSSTFDEARRADATHRAFSSLGEFASVMALGFAIVVWPVMAGSDNASRTVPYYGFLWGTVAAAVLLATESVFEIGSMLRKEPRLSWYGKVRISLLIAQPIVPAFFAVMFVVSNPQFGVIPSSQIDWQIAITTVVLLISLMVLTGLLPRRHTHLFMPVLGVAVAILALGLSVPILEKAVRDAGWATEAI